MKQITTKTETGNIITTYKHELFDSLLYFAKDAKSIKMLEKANKKYGGLVKTRPLFS